MVYVRNNPLSRGLDGFDPSNTKFGCTICPGCFVASANRRSYDSAAFAGCSWLVSPEGEILGETSADIPSLTVEIDLEEATRAKSTYPRNLPVL